MADEVFRPEKRRLSSSEMHTTPEENVEALANVHAVHRAASSEPAASSPYGGENPIKFKGTPPPALLAAMKAAENGDLEDDEEEEYVPAPRTSPRQRDGSDEPRRKKGNANPFADAKQSPISEQFEAILNRIKGTTQHYTTVELPSKGKFYDGTDGPENGVLHVRPMTGEEEQILATPRFLKGGKAIDMIFRNCVRERFNPERMLTADRTALLIFLRGISYGRNYDVEIKCNECGNKFATTVDLDNAVDVEECPESFHVGSLTDTLPVSGLRFSYRLSRGRDEAAVQQYREKKLKSFTDATDDTLAYRAALLLTEIEGITSHDQIQALHKQLPIGDVSYIRNVLNEPPFGVNTEIPMSCPFCYAEFNTDLPLDTNFFFPKPKKKEQASS
jgi:hypothetical protein